MKEIMNERGTRGGKMEVRKEERKEGRKVEVGRRKERKEGM